MRRILPFLILTLTGCNAPIAAFLDTCFPSRAKVNPDVNTGPGVDVTPRPQPDPVRPGPPGPVPGPAPGPLPPPDFGQ
jgi:hypothetical protein